MTIIADDTETLRYLRQEARAIVARITKAWRAPDEGEPLSAYVGRYLTTLETQPPQPTKESPE